MTLPELGQAVRGEWNLDPDWVTVNHGSFGATPDVVMQEQARWQRLMERQPSAFMHTTLPGALRVAAAEIAGFVGAQAEDVAFVDNATSGCAAVLRSMRLAAGDEIVVLTHGYGAVRNTVAYVAERAGARMVDAVVPFPEADDDAIVSGLKATLTSKTRLAVIDHITSPTALVLPVPGMIAACHAAGVPVLVDGAHAPGHVDLDLTALDADWYVGNCHKWLNAPKGCGFIWARPDRQEDLHPVTISHGLGGGFLAEFDWTGTRDPSAFLAVGAAIAFHQRLGGPAMRARNAALAGAAGVLLAERLGTESHHSPGGSMAIVRMPVVGPATRAHAQELRERLFTAKADAPLMAQDGRIWLRVSAAAYNEIGDYERLGEIVDLAFRGNA